MTVSIATVKDDFHSNHSVVMMNRNNNGGDFSGGNRQHIAAILSIPMCIDDKEDNDMRLVSPRVVSPLECSMEPLKGTTTTTTSDLDLGDANGSQRLVEFSDNVSVIFIPRRCDYPKDLRDQLFPNKKEISRNAARNMKEYAADGFDWRKVKEDQEMYIDANGERVHPIHLFDIWAKRKTLLPAKPDLPKPTLQRPMHPKLRSTNNSFAHSIARPSTPVPTYSTDFE